LTRVDCQIKHRTMSPLRRAMLTSSTYCRLNNKATTYAQHQTIPCGVASSLLLSASLGQAASKDHLDTCQAVYEEAHDSIPDCHHICPGKAPYCNMHKLIKADGCMSVQVLGIFQQYPCSSSIRLGNFWGEICLHGQLATQQ